MSDNTPAKTILAFPGTDLTGAGRPGLIACQDIPAGTIVQEEESLLILDIEGPFTEWSHQLWKEFFENEYRGKTWEITQALRKMSQDQKYRYRQLPAGPLRRRQDTQDISRAEANAMIIHGLDDEEEPTTLMLILPILSRINHSCRPNAVFQYKDGKGTIRATTNIRKGGEIVIDRLPDDIWLNSVDERQQYLQLRYGIGCRCEDCNPQTLWQGEELRQRLRDLSQSLDIVKSQEPQLSTTLDFEETQAVSRMLGEAYEYLALVSRMGLRDWRLAEAHVTVAKLYGLMGCKTEATKHASLVLVVISRAYGSSVDSFSGAALEILTMCCSQEW